MSLSVTDISNNIFINETGQSSLTTIPEIAFWVRSSGLGALNSLIYQSYTINDTTLEIEPDTFGIDEYAILAQLYVLKFIQFQINGLIGASGLVGNEIIEWSEKNHTIRRQNRNEVSKSWITLKSQANDNLKDLIGSYKVNRSGPRQIIGLDGISTLGEGWYDAYNRSAYRYGGI